MSRWTRRFAVVVAVGVLAAFATGVVMAQTEEEPTTIDACVDGRTGALRVVGEGGSCRQNETSLSWATGLLSHEIVHEDRIFEPGVTFSSGGFGVDCPAGKKVTGGGGVGLITNPRTGELGPGSNSEIDIENDFPTSETRWAMFYEFRRSTGTQQGVRVFAVCAS